MNITRIGTVGAVALVAAVALAGCSSTSTSKTSSSATPSSSASASTTVDVPAIDSSLAGTITAGGSSAQANAEIAWSSAIKSQAAGIVVNYDKSQGSGGGVTNWLNGAYDFAGSDSPLSAAQYAQAKTSVCANGNPIDVPAYLSGVALAYNLSGVSTLKLDSATVAKIFTLQIKTWNDPAIAATNPGVTLPSTAITVISRSDGSGTTNNFTTYLHDVQPSIFTETPGSAWPVPGTSGQQGGSGVVAAVTAGAGTIGYVDQSALGTLKSAQVQIGTSKNFAAYSAAGATNAFAAAATAASQGTGDLSQVLDYTKITAANSYPIPLLSYQIFCTSFKDSTQASLTKAYLGFIGSTLGQAVAAKNAASAPLPDSILKEVQKSVALIK